MPSIIAARIDPVSYTPDQIATLNAALTKALDMLQTTQISLSSSLSEALQPNEALRVSRNYLPFFGGALTLDTQENFGHQGKSIGLNPYLVCLSTPGSVLLKLMIAQER
jgi:hypothetical protein